MEAVQHAYVVRQPGVCGGRPTIRGTRITVEAVAYRHKCGESVDEMLEAWPHLTAAQLYDAISFYYDYRAEIDADIELSSDEAFWMSKYPPGKR